MSEAKWSYLDSANQKQGPFPKHELLRLAETGEINGRTLVWRSGMADWLKLGEVAELKANPSGGDAPGNLLTNRLGEQGLPSQKPITKKGIPGSVKFAALVVLIAGIVLANKVFLILPGAGGVVESDLSDRWFSADNREGAIMQATFQKKAGKGPNGGPRFRVSAVVSAGVARNRVLPVDRENSSRVVIRDSSGKEVLNKAVSNAKLCPS